MARQYTCKLRTPRGTLLPKVTAENPRDAMYHVLRDASFFEGLQPDADCSLDVNGEVARFDVDEIDMLIQHVAGAGIEAETKRLTPEQQSAAAGVAGRRVAEKLAERLMTDDLIDRARERVKAGKPLTIIDGNHEEHPVCPARPVGQCEGCSRPLYAGDTIHRLPNHESGTVLCDECYGKAQPFPLVPDKQDVAISTDKNGRVYHSGQPLGGQVKHFSMVTVSDKARARALRHLRSNGQSSMNVEEDLLRDAWSRQKFFEKWAPLGKDL